MTADAAFWDKIADYYASQPVERPDAFERKIAITKARMTPQDVVLNVGCGTGTLSLRLADSGRELHGLDISSEMVRIARDKARDVDNVTFHHGTLDTFTALGPSSVDGVMAYSLLHLVDDRERFLKQLFSLVKPGGFFVSSTVCLGDSWIPYSWLIGAMRLVGRAPRVEMVGRQQLLDEVAAAGFVDVETHEVGAKETTVFMTATRPR
jgi:arsenite methyltransferase